MINRASTIGVVGVLTLSGLVGLTACSQGSPTEDGLASNSADLDISQYESPPPIGPSADSNDTTTVLPLTNGAVKRTRTAAALMFDISSGPPNATNVTNLLKGPGTSLRHMYQEISYGLQDLAIDLYGPYTLPVANCLTIACCGPSSDKTGNGATVTAEIAALPMKYDHYFWDYGPIPGGANCGTWGDEGSASKPAVYSSYSFQGIVGQAQELGHNLGMTHEPVMTKCAGGVPMADDTTQCTHNEYGNTLSFMGGGAHHPSAYHKYQEGWLSGCNVVKAGASDTFTLVPQELPCDGVQLLQIKAPKDRPQPAAGDRQNNNAETLGYYYLEMRAPYGFDSNLGPMVLVSIGADLPTPTQNGSPYLYMLTLGGTSQANAGLKTVGQSYADPGGGLTITLTAIDSRSATVQVTMTGGTGSHVCSDNTAFTAPGPTASSCSPLAGGDGGLPEAGRATTTGGSTGTTGTTTTTGTTGGRGGTTGTTGRTTTGGTTAGATSGATTGATTTTGATATTGAATTTTGATATTGAGGTTASSSTTTTSTSAGTSSGTSSGVTGSGTATASATSSGAATSGGTTTAGPGTTSTSGTGSVGPRNNPDSGLDSGCACSTAGGSKTPSSSAWLACALVGVVYGRSRSRAKKGQRAHAAPRSWVV